MNSGSARHNIKIVSDEIEITTGIIGFKFMGIINSESTQLVIGSTCAQSIELVLINDIDLFGKEVKVYSGIEDEYKLLGLFTMTKSEETNGQYSYKGYDRMVDKYNLGYFTKLSGANKTKDYLDEISRLTGVSWINTFSEDINITMRGGYTYREVIGYIAALHGTNAIINPDGKLEFRWYSTVNYVPAHIYEGGFTKTANEDYVLNRIDCTSSTEATEITYKAGTGSYGIKISNPFMTKDILNLVYNKIKGLSFRPMTISMFGDILPEVGDIIEVTENGQKYNCPIMSIEHDYDGGYITNISCVGSMDAAEIDTTGPLTRGMERYYAEVVLINKAFINKLDAKEASITYATIENLKATNTALINKLDAKEASITYATIENLNVINSTLTNKLDAKEASITYATIENLKVTNTALVNKLDAKVASITYATIENLKATNAAITTLSAKAVTTEYLKANVANIDLSNVNTSCISTALIKDGAITSALIADAAITDAKIVGLTANKITAGTLSVERLEIIGSKNSVVYALNNSGDLVSTVVDTINADVLTDKTITADKIVASAITADKIAANAVTANKIIANAITADKIATNAVTAVKVSAGAITTDKIAANAVTAVKIVASAITADKIATNAVTANKIIANAVTSDKIAANAITAVKIAAGAITSDKIAAKAITAAKIDVDDLFSKNITVSGSLQSDNYVYSSGNFSESGLKLNMETGEIISESFSVDLGGSFSLKGGLYMYYYHVSNKVQSEILKAAWLTPTSATMGNYKLQLMDNISKSYYAYSSIASEGTIFSQGNMTCGGTLKGNLITCDNTITARAVSVTQMLSCGYTNIGYTLSTASFICNSWIRTNGNTGWFNQTYNGGWYMIDSTWIRSYNSKFVYVDTQLSSGFLGVNYTGTLSSTSYKFYCNGAAYLGSLNMGGKIYLANSNGVYAKLGNGANATAIGSLSGTNILYLGDNSYMTMLRGSTVYLKSTSATVTSDLRLKESVDYSLEKYVSFFHQLRPISFKYKTFEGEDGQTYGSTSGRTHLSFGAQDVYKALKDNGLETKDFAGYVDFSVNGGEDELALAPTEFIPLNTYMIQVCLRKIATLENEIIKMKKGKRCN